MRSSRVGSSSKERSCSTRSTPAARSRARPGPLGERPVGDPQRDRVDREVAPREVLLDRRAGPHVGQRAGLRVGLRARGHHVEGRRLRAHDGRAEAVVHHQLAPEPLGRAARDRDRVALDDDVELARDPPEQRVAHRAADDVHAGLPRERVQRRLRARGAGHQLQKVHDPPSSRVRVPPVDRPALDRRLAAALDRGPLMLVAPAGGGKTTALAAALEHRGGAVAWVSCEPADADPGRLLARIVGAVQAAAPGTADALAATLAGATERDPAPSPRRACSPPPSPSWRSRSRSPSTTPSTSRPRPSTWWPCSPRRPPRGCGSRSRRPSRCPCPRHRSAPASSRSRARSAPRCSAPPRRPPGRPAPGDRSRSPSPRAPAGRPRPASRSTTRSSACSPSLDPELRAALVDSAAAPRLDAAVLRALQPPDGFAGALAVERHPADGHRGRDRRPPAASGRCSRAGSQQERPSEYRELLHARIARALDEDGRGAEAVEHWLEVPEEAAAAVARHGGAIADTAPATAARWLSRIDGPARLAPELRLLEGRLALGDGRLLDAPGPLREAVVGFEVRGDEAQAWVARLALADALAIGERFDAAIPLAGGFERTTAPAAPMVAVTAAAALAATGAYDEAVALFERAVAGPRGAPFAPFAAAFRAAWVDLQLGALDAALERARSASAGLRRERPVPPARLHARDRGGDPRGARRGRRRRWRRSPARGSSPAGPRRAARSRTSAGASRPGCWRALGRADEAEAELAALEGPGTGWYAGDVHVTRAAIASARGDDTLAAAEARRAIDAGALRVWRTRARTVAALAPVLRGAARGLVEDALEARPPHASAARLLALRAWLRSLEGDAAGAAAGVAEAFAEAGDGAAHLLRRERPRLAPLLADAVARSALDPEAAAAAIAGAAGRATARGAQGRRERGLQVQRVGAGGEHREALPLLGDVLGREAVHAGDDPGVRARRVHGRERLQHGRVLEPERRLQPEREREVRRADVDAVQPGRARRSPPRARARRGSRSSPGTAAAPPPRRAARRTSGSPRAGSGRRRRRGPPPRRWRPSARSRRRRRGPSAWPIANGIVGGHAHERDRARPGDRLQHRPSASPGRARRAAGRRRRSRGRPAPTASAVSALGIEAQRPIAGPPRSSFSRRLTGTRRRPRLRRRSRGRPSCAGSRRPCRRPARTGHGRRGAPGACRPTASRPGRSAASRRAGAPCRRWNG